MKTSTFLGWAVAGLASAQQLSPLPACATQCANIFLAGGGIGNCGTSPKCICAQSDFITKIGCCVMTACSVAEQQQALGFAHQICEANGITNLPTTVSCESGAPAPPQPPATSTSSGYIPSATPGVNGSAGGGGSSNGSSPGTPVYPHPPATTSAPPNVSSNAVKELGSGMAVLGSFIAAVALL